MKDKEIRNFQLLELRVENVHGQDIPLIVGDAAVYNSRSVDLGGFTEVIEPGFFENVLEGDTRALFNHNENYILGRTRSDTLRLLDHEAGLGFQVEVPDTQIINDLVMVPMKRGDLNQCSFAFTVSKGGDEWRELPDGNWERILKRGGCEQLYDISIVTYPAYEQTSAQARAMFEKIIEDGGGESRAGTLPIEQDPGDESRAGNQIRKRKLWLMKELIKR